MAELTPMLRQYYEVKKQYPDAILMFRLGDFYEMFGEDAVLASRMLDIVLTSRNKSSEIKMPMCGVPYHAVDNYIGRLVKQGQKVAICDQMEDPATAKGIVKREVTRVITPGTYDESSYLSSGANNYLLSVYPGKESVGLAWADVSTGELTVRQVAGEPSRRLDLVRAELSRIAPSEVIMPESLCQSEGLHEVVTLVKEEGFTLFPFADWAYLRENAVDEIKKQFRVTVLEGFGLAEQDPTVQAAGALLSYLHETQKRSLDHITQMKVEQDGSAMFLDDNTIRSLEIVEDLHRRDREASLLSVMQTSVITTMGQRLLRRWLLRPLIDPLQINARLSAVEILRSEKTTHAALRELLTELGDMERLSARLALGRIMPRELIRLKESVALIPGLKEALGELDVAGDQSQGAVLEPPLRTPLREIVEQLQELPEVVERIEQTLISEPAAVLGKGSVIRQGFHPEMDELIDIKQNGRDWIKRLETAERERTHINTLKVGYNRVFGYYIEVTHANSNDVPEDYIRKQTLVNAERFITPELKEHEAKVLGAEERIVQLEQELYSQLVSDLSRSIMALQQNAHAIATLDVLSGFAELATQNSYVRPVVDGSDILEITEGRHPVVERLSLGERFIPNDTSLAGSGAQVMVLTGPNMAGKSTYLRQVALITLMAQIGSFVPASCARIGVVDRIFTRIGASDDLSRGQSTFMVEMQETANILNNATPRSLIILDEIGRGTSTFDGLSIAWSVVEYLHGKGERGPKTLFATHYHELVQLADELSRVRNFNIAVREIEGRVVFLRKIVPGGVDQSYGIQVAQLAGLPREVMTRAFEVLSTIEDANQGLEDRLGGGGARSSDVSVRAVHEPPRLGAETPTSHPALTALKEIKIETLTPLQALNILSELKQKSDV
ncbi:DNA mismatch repair protein MutS [Candidatus Wirthbacteria bacterium CG2_30_54_11]|uniref:DNA mismatch repair protein MutS n=1 Tax=Candidatus Wirthbacteria bacterium CG2_30_54_11 TaxID=1817892 RepID=A0A1J5IZY0_9BACT|nr:MAG: DNA mismatch repair protein MutS [Candidatus Wirthbacteria bacterium CG2_30_54_11]